MNSSIKPESTLRKYLSFALRTLFLVILDQGTKIAVRKYLALHETVPVIRGFFNLFRLQNPGAAFGFLAGAEGKWVGLFFIVLAIAATAFIVYLYSQLAHGETFMRVSLTLIAAGAVGNLCDRITVGTVTDFLDFYIGAFHWYTFNVADSCITVGAIMALVHPFFAEREKG